MHHIGLIRPFRATHYLIGGDWGAENQPHHHDYRVEWILGGRNLDQHGYLLDLLAVEAVLDGVLADVRDRCLNDLPGWEGLNPSVERLAHSLWQKLTEARGQWDPQQRLSSSVVKVWENDVAWASWSEDLPPLRVTP